MPFLGGSYKGLKGDILQGFVLGRYVKQKRNWIRGDWEKGGIGKMGFAHYFFIRLFVYKMIVG